MLGLCYRQPNRVLFTVIEVMTEKHLNYHTDYREQTEKEEYEKTVKRKIKHSDMTVREKGKTVASF